MLLTVPNGLDELIATFGTLDDPDFEQKHIMSFELPYPCFMKAGGSPIEVSSSGS